MADAFSKHQSSLNSPAKSASEIAPSDLAALSSATRALYVGGAGDVRVTMVGGETVTFRAVPAGCLLPVRVAQLHSTGTTATAIVGLR